MKSETFPGVSDVLKRARLLIARGWCKDALAETDAGVKVGSSDRDATRFCAIGAIQRAHADLAPLKWSLSHDALERLGVAIGDRVIFRWNNAPERTKEEVLAAFDQAAGGK